MKGIKVLNTVVNFIYPSRCLHCKKSLTDINTIFCEECIMELELIDPNERCPRCFSDEYFPEEKYCRSCANKSPVLDGIASAFTYMGPPSSLIKGLKYTDMPFLSRGISAYLATQLSRLDWPWPDVLVPVPMSLSKWWERGYNQSLLLAQELGNLTNIPIARPLKRKCGDFSQAELSREQRQQLSEESFTLRKQESLKGKNVLIIDDVATTGMTLIRCAEKLLTLQPSKVYGLTACYAQKG